MYTPATSCVKGTSVRIKNIRIKQGLRFCEGFPGVETFRGLEERAPGPLNTEFI